ncbi:cytochrome c biogenesis protein ResB [Tomitella biformata]|uniref:cytochrome c biogenesis protein ResB n=1 Tax=Tomitella biformata TaxID=630403 RepID=UPI00046421B8|nr:cytochrome c biogenesis protein ResB [Tomitella biformata]
MTSKEGPELTAETTATPSPIRRAAATVRNLWRSLTSMRTALVLLFLLALAAIPGALVPQRSLNSQKVDQYIADHKHIGPLFDTLQVYNVFGSSWFTAIYVLLFISLVGCITPRVAEHFRALRTPPVRAPRRLSRLPHHAESEVEGSAEENADTVRAALRGWRQETRTEPGGVITISAERGYLREAGNLVFHIALVGVLVTVAMGKIFGYEGNVIIIADGQGGFCNSSPAMYDTFRAGLKEDGTGLHPFCVEVKDFKADYLPNGQADMFTSNIRYQAETDLDSGTWHDYQLKVNDPLRVDGARVYLQGHGFAPTFTVTFPDGSVRTKTLQFAPEEVQTFLSSGAVLFDPPGELYPTLAESRQHQIAIEGLFAPTAVFEGTLLTSGAPTMTDPAVAIDIYKGDSGLDSGRAQSIFRLDPRMIDQGRLVKQERTNLRAGESVTLEDGTVVSFDGAQEFVNLQVSYDPTQVWVLVSAVTMMAGMLVSLVIKRRRIWARITPAVMAAGPPPDSGDGPDGVERRTVVELGGLARTDHAGWGEEFTKLSKRLLAEETREEQRPPQA